MFEANDFLGISKKRLADDSIFQFIADSLEEKRTQDCYKK